MVEKICLKIKAFFFSDHSVNSRNLSTWLYIEIVRRKFILVTLGTERVKPNCLLANAVIIYVQMQTGHQQMAEGLGLLQHQGAC